MDLDTVELIIEFEKYFQIQIEDKEAEQAATINDVVKLVCYKKGVVSKSCKTYNQFTIYLLQ